MTDMFYRVLFISIFALFWSIRIYYVWKTRDPEAPRSREERRAAMTKEGPSGILILLLSYVEIAVVLLYLWAPPWMTWADLEYPVWFFWIGAVLMLCSIPFMMWVHRTLGLHYSFALETKNEQKIVTSGPYKRIRHPLYSAHNLFNLGMVFLTAYIPLIVFALLGVPLTYLRMRDEERMMVEKFGNEYDKYMKRTGRIFPKI